MAYNDDQKPQNLPAGNTTPRRKSADHLPRYFRTNVNNKFLSATVDQLIQPGVAEKLNGYYGQKNAKGYQKGDFYIGDVSKSREDYQLEPVSLVKDDLNNIDFYADYNDYINQLNSLGSAIDDHSVLNRQEYYAWNPHIDWDKFVNFREYYWLPNGPQTIQIAGETDEVTKTYQVTSVNNGEHYGYVFNPDGQTQNPTLTLYRGVTYRFEIDASGNPLSFRTRKETAPIFRPNISYFRGDKVQYEGSIYLCTDNHNAGNELDIEFWDLDTTFNLTTNVSAQSIDNGVIELTLDASTPNLIYYMSDNDVFASGTINVLDLVEASSINVEQEILKLKTYTTGTGVSLSNGMKVEFVGNVTPEKYAEGAWYVEGVGSEIDLISEVDLSTPSAYTDDIEIGFDNDENGFGVLPFSEAVGYPLNKDYLTINRGSRDGNLWSKYNRWFHKDVIEKSAEANKQVSNIDQSQRATRPIIEFNANLKLYNFGTKRKLTIDLVDSFTKDVFSTIEGSVGYNIDDVDVTNGMRILFTADPDPRVYGKIFEVKFITFQNKRQITLQETEDTDPLLNEVLLCNQGTVNRGRMLWFDGSVWKLAQQKTEINQAPLFDVFDENGNSYSDTEVFDSTTFAGTKIFSYAQGYGANDTELGFPLEYRSIENVGDIVFKFNLLDDVINCAYIGEDVITKPLSVGYIRQYPKRNTWKTLSGWTKASLLSNQPVIRQYINDNTRTFFTLDVYENSALLDDLWLRVFVNNNLKFENTDFTIGSDNNNNLTITFNYELSEGDVIILKTRSSAEKTQYGKYEIASNLERNPLNQDITEFTLGEVNDHVGTIIEELTTFSGVYPGFSNLRDLGEVSQYGKRIVKHSCPINLPLYHIVDKEANIVKSLKFARREYGKFKRSFLQKANDLGFSGPVKDHVDLILNELTKDKIKTMPFYFSDMVPFTGSVRSTTEVLDEENNFFALNKIYNFSQPSSDAVQVYLNGIQLILNKDYTFNDQGFVIITANKSPGDIIDIYEYESTNGSYVPPTPTKLGIYPKYEPKKYIDNTYLEPQEVIQGHDGSITVAYDDFRDDLILELEKRIYNNIKVDYDPDMFDIYDYIPGHSRNTGIEQSQINDSMISDFIQWIQLVDEDYTNNTFFERENSFTFNYTGVFDPQDRPLNGWWRAVYKYAFDTDRPHTHPWEMQGFSIKPDWWEDQYGSAPYTSNNLLMWEDIEKGIVRFPDTPGVSVPKFARNNITNNIPVDEDGNLLSPVYSSFVKSYNTTELNRNFVFGDHSPIETAWRKGSEYPFSLITALVLNQPARTFASIFDRVRQTKNLLGQRNYLGPNEHITLQKLVFPNDVNETNRVFTSGLINYVYDYLASSVTTTFNNYKNRLSTINNQLGFKIGGFTTKDKFKLILDSRTPLNKGNVFVPEENYNIFLNKSSPVKSITYSGVIIEKQSFGFIVRGYDQVAPYFTYNPAIPLQNDPLINIGGINASFVEWDSRKTYVAGAIVQHQNSFYRVVETHDSGQEFDETKFVKIPELPVQGGREAYFRKAFKNNSERLPYGTVFKNIQDLVDFLLGYGYWLEKQGFVFDFYSAKDEFVSNWQTSAKEFMFWTTQNWNAGSVITLSPGAFQIKFISEYSVVDDIYDTFYGYSLLKADGKKLQPENVTLTRENPKEFIIKPKATEDGIYSVRLSLVQKEHALIIDNKTVFGDIIYDQEPGYRQQRLKVLGYRTDNWDGSLNIPGFVFDNAKITEWKPWQDYAIGDLVKYKEFYYSAKNKVTGTEVFVASEWVRLSEKPEMGLIPNFEYKTNQFADFYDLDTDNFDVEQQKFAQHLIGYQNRDYLANIINDDVSQYKFYQGMIQDKGSKNALTKLFDVLGSADKDSLEFYEEWAIKQGQYGAAQGFEEVEFILDEDQFKLQPQSVELVNQIRGDETDLVYRIRPFEVFLRPTDYDHKPFPTTYVDKTYTKNSGYVNPEDVDFTVSTFDNITNIDYTKLSYGDIVWAGNVGLGWDVYLYTSADIVLESVSAEKEFVFKTLPTMFSEGDIIGIEYTDAEGVEVKELAKVTQVLNNKIKVNNTSAQESETITNPIISRFISVRVKDFDEASKLVQTFKTNIGKIWIDEDLDKKWRVIEQKASFEEHQVISNTESGLRNQYGISIDASDNNTLLVVGSPDDDDGKVFVYVRAGNSGAYSLNQVVEPELGIADSNQKFGASVAVTDNGRYLIVGSPEASNVRSTFKGDYDSSQDYSQFDIITYKDNNWQATKDIEGAEVNINFGSFESVPEILRDLGQIESNADIKPALLTGDYPFTNINTDHFLIKAPFDMYEGSGIGDTVKLVWNKLTQANQDIDTLQEVLPFADQVPDLSAEFLTAGHIISEKIDSILYVENSNTIPLVGQIVETQTGFGEVSYTFNDGAKATIYIKNQNGTFGFFGSLTTSIGEFVGEYVTVAPNDTVADADEKWGGYWRVEKAPYLVSSINSDVGRGLVYTDVIPSGNPDPNRFYYNILNYQTDISSSLDSIHSQITTLSYRGNPGPGGVTDDFESSLWVARAPKPLTDVLNVVAPGDQSNDTVDFFYNDLPNYNTGNFNNPEDIGLGVEQMNKTHTIYDVWDGYIDFRITKNLGGIPIEPKVGLTVRDVTNLGTAEVMFYQRFDTNNGRIYVKNVTGNWAVGNLFGENREIEFLADGSGDALYDPISGSRVFGQIEQRAFPLDEANIGKLVVFDNSATINVQDVDADVTTKEDTILDNEYWFYREETVLGIARPANIPTIANNDWELIYNIPASIDGVQSGLTKEGMFSIYERKGIGAFVKLNSFTVTERGNNQYLGSELKVSNNNEFYRLIVKQTGDGTNTNPGRLYMFNNGEFNGIDYGWESARDKNYRGPFDDTTLYYPQEIVYYNNKLYQAEILNGPGTFDVRDWNELDQNVNYLGFIPNRSANIVTDADQIIEDENLLEFARAYDISKDGEVIVITTTYNENAENTVEIYRNINGLFYRDQTILSPSKLTQYGSNIALSNDGKLIAVGAPYNDDEGLDHGTVYVYKQQDGSFLESQKLYSPKDDKTELFGWSVDFDGDRLIIGSANGDSLITTTFDGSSVGNEKPVTTFDKEFTTFKNITQDTGNIRVYERLNDYMLYSQTIDFDRDNVSLFGRSVLLRKNHVYAGLPTFKSGIYTGAVVDYRLDDNTTIWENLRVTKNPVDVSKIKRAVLYNTKTNTILQYIDYIDVLQGKIAGPAEQELTYKTPYDPATYNTGIAPNTDKTNSWGEAQEGQLWWDLTNAKFRNPYQGNVIFSSNNWNSSFSNQNSIDVYEWVKSKYLPSEWDEKSGTNEGLKQGITGKTRSGDDAYVLKRVYDTASGTFTNYYYYWVRNKTTLPAIEDRKTTARDVARLIRDPANEGYKFIALITENEFAVFNCENILSDRDIALSIQYWTIEDQNINIHNQYQIITEGLETSLPSTDIQRKWFDSLVGYDEKNRQVPAPELSAKEKYGILNKPRQGWFINREEALKETIERINSVLKDNLISDDKDITNLTDIDPEPTKSSKVWDRSVDTKIELQFVGVAKAEQATLEPVVENGKIVRVNITNGGRGYLQEPTVTVLGTGKDAEIKTVINNQGTVTDVIIENAGTNYAQDNTRLAVRRYTVLVKADESLNNKWALYERDTVAKEWILVESQAYDVTKYWDYIDWYAPGYNSFTKIDTVIEQSYDLSRLNDSIGDIVKIQTVGTGGWLLLEKINNQEGEDYSVNYKTIGRENGTIQFKETLYNVEDSKVGFDTTNYDALTFDSLPTTETRIILNTIKDNVFIEELALEYNKLFFASLRYVFAEQNYVDWAFKSSFIKAKHNVGELEQKVNFQNDNLPSYEEYIKEVKPFKTKIREYLSSYESTDVAGNNVSDFDLPARYVLTSDGIEPLRVKSYNTGIVADNPEELENYPNKNWIDNSGYKVVKIELDDPGQGYTSPPTVTIEGNKGAVAKASLGKNGSISGIRVFDQGEGYLESPKITLNGSISPGGREASAYAIIGNSPVRSIKTIIKFDRVSGTYEFVNLDTIQNFVASGSIITFDLDWPMDLRTTTVRVFENDDEVLARRYTYSNQLDKSKGYDRYLGQLKFVDPPVANSNIRIEYSKDINLLKAQDRINLAYQPTGDNFGKTLGQLMDGVDYGGVQVRSFDFGGTTGWNTAPWMTQGWDVFDTAFEDEIFLFKTVIIEFDSPISVRPNEVLTQNNTLASGKVIGSTETTVTLQADFDSNFSTEDEIYGEDSTLIGADSSVRTPINVSNTLPLNTPLEEGIEYNVYRTAYDANGQVLTNYRVDDSEWDGSTVGTQDNPYANMLPIQGNQETELDVNDLGVDTELQTGEVRLAIVIRKVTSDGSFIPDPDSFDTSIDGGNLIYGTATGLDSADINIDGDGFVTPTTSKGPEEIVPGQTLDTVDIQVYEKPSGGSSQITCRNYIGNGVKSNFDIGTPIGQFANLFVKVDYTVMNTNDYTVDVATNQVIFFNPPADNSRINIINLGVSATTILDIDTFIGNGTTIDFLTNARFEDNANGLVTVDGEVVDITLVESDDTYENSGNFVVRFATPPKDGAIIQMMLAVGGVEIFQQYSTVNIDTFTADGSTTQYELSQAPFEQQPESAYVLVKVNNKILDPGYSQKFEVTTALREYQLDLTQIPTATVNSFDLAVYLNGIELEYLQNWTFEGAGSFNPNVPPQSQPGSTVTLAAGIGEDGDELTVYVLTSGEYRMGYYEQDNTYVKTPKVLNLDNAFSEDDTITVYQFSNHDSQGFERQSFEVTEKTETTPGTKLYYDFKLLEKGYITLRKPARDAEYVWVVKNGDLLSPSVDYSITSNRRYVKLVQQPNEGDKLQVLHFSDNTVVDKFGWRQFKDILNRTHYKRLEEIYHLEEPLNWYDKTIKVVDGNGLPEPEVGAKYPGVIFIEGERIEYFRKVGNELLQLRRGTLGTGVKDVYDAGTMLMEQGVDTTLPYKDEEEIITVTSSGFSTGSDSYENSPGMGVTSITYDFNNNTAFPLGGQVTTVIGTGFTDRVEIYVGTTKCEATFISENELTFVTPALPVGSYDLIVVNPFTTVPIDTPQTSFVVPGGIKYVQILLPFAPIPNPASATDWYKDTIPEEYWEAQDIEVFVAGRRLRKTPISKYNYDAQDSPEGDIILEAEYAVNKNIGAYVRLTTPPPEGTTVTIIRKIGTTWSDRGTTIANSDSNIAKFLRAKTTELPR